jgi:hypothetical protein
MAQTEWSGCVKKGRHRRFEEARALKRSNEVVDSGCAECGAEPGDEHKSWCLAMEDDEEGSTDSDGYSDQPVRPAP